MKRVDERNKVKMELRDGCAEEKREGALVLE